MVSSQLTCHPASQVARRTEGTFRGKANISANGVFELLPNPFVHFRNLCRLFLIENFAELRGVTHLIHLISLLNSFAANQHWQVAI